MPVHRAAVEWARAIVLARGPSEVTPDALRFLLRDYVVSADPAARDLVEQGLTTALAAAHADPDARRQLCWLRVLTDAALLSDDERVSAAVAKALPSAVDALEAFVRRTYEPGEGLIGVAADAQLRWSAALLDAFDLSGRLPYAMMADELLHYARARWWRQAEEMYDVDFAANCHALRALCRLASLHADPDYRASAVLPPRSSCSADARALSERLVARAHEHPECAAEFGGALLDWFALEPKLQ